MSTAAPSFSDSVQDPMHPFGLPPGSVRGLLSLLICSFFWILLLWPGDATLNPMLGHFFMLSLVLMAFASSNVVGSDTQKSAMLPWLMRVLFVGGSLVVVGLVLIQHPERFQTRLTPNIEEFKAWWGPMLACMSGGFAFGLLLRFFLGRTNVVFRTLRSWLSVIGLLMLSIEIALYIIFLSSSAQHDWLAYFQAVELAIVAAYFGTRA